MDRVHDILHVSTLRCYRFAPSHFISIKETEVRPDLFFEEEPLQILEHDVKVLKRKQTPLVMSCGKTMESRRPHGKQKTRFDNKIITYSNEYFPSEERVRQVKSTPQTIG
ncbi:serine/threonine-protein phosphatase 6 regulatory ankyrin repeat subunit C-like [Gossypium australe]|uniref:Serine/threonine-protein phosphatase 6 regulatory ankyrin repeat subunit C-like n=1 Tax=Gossypium australe TaxID=47621 RepID=A0A5B6VPH3_9ROSI|nr:serine/threonine-protein phosphatase 6 regulatory ankyrin repeat subunit C-like [Gossypium australe]